MPKVFIFNPDHEIALANNDPNFKPKQNISILKNDLTTLPLWLNSGYYISKNAVNKEWIDNANLLDLRYHLSDEINLNSISQIDAWGWNRSVCKELIGKDIKKSLLPTAQKLEIIYHLTQRKTAIDAMRFLKHQITDNTFPPLPSILYSISDIENFVNSNDKVVLKSPLGESGKGVYFVYGHLNDSLKGWLKRTIQQQKYIVAEKLYNVTQNFAMEFEVCKKETSFVGYSLFMTNGKAYKQNILISDKKIEETLSEYIGYDVLYRLRNNIISFIEENITDDYNGYLGVDMFIFEECERFFLHPCVEINLRPTMGLIAHKFYNNFVDISNSGIFTVDFFNNPKELIIDHKKRKFQNPLQITNNKISKGYISLCPIFEDTQYRIRVEIANGCK